MMKVLGFNRGAKQCWNFRNYWQILNCSETVSEILKIEHYIFQYSFVGIFWISNTILPLDFIAMRNVLAAKLFMWASMNVGCFRACACFGFVCMRFVLRESLKKREREHGGEWAGELRTWAQRILLKHKFYIEWHLNNNNRPSIIFTTPLCRAYRFLFRMNHAIDKVCWRIFAVCPNHCHWFHRHQIPATFVTFNGILNIVYVYVYIVCCVFL